jgi:hypothetical protein
VEARRRGLKPWITRAVLLIALALTGTAAPPASAASAGIEVLENAVQNSFPKTIQFSVRAQSSSQISSVRLAYRLGDDPITFVANANYTPAFRIVATYPIDLQREYVPPGVIVHFQWQIQDMAGGEFATAWSDLKVTDPRFLWHERTLGNVVVHWYEGDDKFADAILDSASKAFIDAQRDALAPWLGPVQIYVYANDQDFRSALGAGADEWIGGQTFSMLHIVVILATASNTDAARRVAAHEITHATIDGANLDPFGPLPSWLDEGIAMMAEGDPLPFFTDALAKGVKEHRLMTLQSLSGSFPADPDQATLAYGESESIVRYFVKTYGRERLAILIAAFHAGNDADAAFQTTAGVSARDFQQAWMTSLDPTRTNSTTGQSNPASPRATAPGDVLSALVQDFLAIFQSKKASPVE